MLANFLVTELSRGQPVSPLPGEIKSTALWRPVLAIPSLSTFLVVGILLITWGGWVLVHFTGGVGSPQGCQQICS